MTKPLSITEAAEAAGAELYFAEEDGWDAFFPEKSKYGANWKGPIMMPKILHRIRGLGQGNHWKSSLIYRIRNIRIF